MIGKNVLKKTISLLAVFTMMLPVFFCQESQTVSNDKTEIIIHYQEDYQNTRDWNLWVWIENVYGGVHEFTETVDFGNCTAN